MSVPIPSTSLAWTNTDSLLRESGSVDRSVLSVPLPEVASDSELLRDFVASKPGEATAQAVLTRIVERHGAMVYQVALRLVNDRHLADDVFQATFLVLAQSARKIQRSGSLASWLHGTARNIGRRALARKLAERSGTETGVEMVTAVEDDPFHEMMRSHERQLLDEELQQLPEMHRAPLVLFYPEERSHQEISQLLGVSVPAVESRLKRAKQELRSRLMRRGITLLVALAAVGFGASAAAAAPSATLVTSTITLAASGTAVGTSLTAGGSVALQLAVKELAAMSTASKVTALFIGTAGTLTLGGAVLFGALAGGVPGSGESSGSGTPSAVIATQTGLGEFEEPQTFLLAQIEEDKGPEAQAPPEVEADKAPEVEEKADEPDDVNIPDYFEKDDDTVAPSEEMEKPAEDEAAGGHENSEHHGPAVAAFRQLSAKDLKVYQALDQEITLEFPDNTLGEIMGFVGENAGVSVRIDQQALTDAGIDVETRVQFTGTHSLEDALSMLLENVNGTALDSYVERGVVHITTVEKTSDLVRLRFYDLDNGVNDDGGIENFAQAVEQFVICIAEGGAHAEVISLGDSLAIQAPLSYHKQIEEFIAGALQLAEARRAAGKPLPVVPRRPTTYESMQPAA